MSPKCPGQDQRYWTPDDIFDVRCPYCGREIEFWKDEPFRRCRSCQREVRNPRMDLGCAAWCAEADACLGREPGQGKVATPVVERLMVQLELQLHDQPARLARASQLCARVDTLLGSERGEPSIAKPAALLAGAALCPEPDDRDADRPTGDERLLDAEVVRPLLCAAGIGLESAGIIEQVVRSVFAPCEPDRAEARLVRTAIEELGGVD
jgi:hypothetical protein